MYKSCHRCKKFFKARRNQSLCDSCIKELYEEAIKRNKDKEVIETSN